MIRNWWPSSTRFAAPGADDGVLTFERQPGRWRRLYYLLISVPLILAAWGWFGIPGTVPVVIWCWHRRPGGAAGGSGEGGDPVGRWHIELCRVTRARLGPWRTWLALRGGAPLEIFNDEMLPADLACLRREVKARLGAGPASSRQEAAGCSTSNRSE